MTASQITKLLEARHAKDVFVPECKMGAAGSRILDGWALLSTWSPLTTIGYEIKVSRSDWTQDQKFDEYRAACHLFMVVAPKGVVQPGELPHGVGLLEPLGAGTGCRLVLRGKAVRQEPDTSKLVKLMAHVLMWRKDTRDYGMQTKAQRASHWRVWADERQDFQLVGRSVRGHMRKILVDAIDAKNRAESRAQALEAADAILRELGVTPSTYHWNTRRQIEAALRKDAEGTIADINATIERLARLRNRIEQPEVTEATR